PNTFGTCRARTGSTGTASTPRSSRSTASSPSGGAAVSTSPGRPGCFGEHAAIRRIARESVLMLGGPRALLMQAAHPLVAAGIIDHSRFRQDAWRRLARTMTALYTIVFGTQAQGKEIGAMTRAAHRRVRGARGSSSYSAG